MKDYFVNIVSSLLIATSGWAFNRYALGDSTGGAAEFWSLLALVVLIGSLMLTIRLSRVRDAYVAAHSVDYKFFADPSRDRDNVLCALYRMFGRARIEDFGTDPVTKASGTEGYISADRFFSSGSPFMRPGLFECHAVRSGEKEGKIFVQLSFIPVDADGRTILVRRDPLRHGSEFGGARKSYLSFLSFSPIPTRFHVSAFNPVDAYHNEVPAPWGPFEGARMVFHELGAAVRFGGECKATYLFYVFAVRYPDVYFSGKTDGTSNLKWLFYQDDKAWRKRAPFGKDHDAIVTTASVDELLAFVRKGLLPEIRRNEFCRLWCLRRALSRYKFKEMERRALQDLLPPESELIVPR